MKRYLIITEFGDLIQKDSINQDDLNLSDDGYIMHIVDTLEGKSHVGGTEWEEIQVYKDDQSIITEE